MTFPRSTTSAKPVGTSSGLATRRPPRYLVAATLLVALTGAGIPVAHAQPAAATAAATAAAPAMGKGAMHAAARPGMGHGSGPGMDHGMSGPGGMSERMLTAVGASAEQKTKIRDLLKAAHDDGHKQHDSERELRQKMMALMAAPQVDAAAAEGLRQQMQAQRDVASKRHLQAMLDVAAVLTPEQRQKLADRMKARQDMMQRHQRERQAIEPRG